MHSCTKFALKQSLVSPCSHKFSCTSISLNRATQWHSTTRLPYSLRCTLLCRQAVHPLSQCCCTKACGQAGAVVPGGPSNVQVRPLGALLDELLQEQCSSDGTTPPASVVFEVSNGGLQLAFEVGVQGESPELLTCMTQQCAVQQDNMITGCVTQNTSVTEPVAL